MIRIPITPVINPPVRKLIRRGAQLAKSFAGLMTLAAILVLMVATATPSRLRKATSNRVPSPASSGASRPGGAVLLVIWLSSTTGSHSVVGSLPLKIVCDALVMTTAIALKPIMAVGRPNVWPSICSR